VTKAMAGKIVLAHDGLKVSPRPLMEPWLLAVRVPIDVITARQNKRPTANSLLPLRSRHQSSLSVISSLW
jgi:hypothetical protein